MRIRQIKKYGNTFIISLKRMDLEELKLKLGDFVNIDDIYKIKR